MIFRTFIICSLALAIAGVLSAQARDFEMGGDSQYPYSIMAPERGTASHHETVSHRNAKPSVAEPAKQIPENSVAAHNRPRHFYAARGSSGSVLPTPLPKTQLIPPENSGTLTLPAPQSEQAPIILQGAARPIPSLPHGPETFQDRASRCSHQAGLNSVPGTQINQYMGACVN